MRTTRRWSATLTRAVSRDGVLHCHWSDGANGRFHHAWLRDHCPQSRHPVSGQRTFELRHLPPDLSPTAIAIAGRGHKLALRWPATTPEVTEPHHNSTFDAAWLRQVACADQAASTSASTTSAAAVPWRPADLDGRLAATSTFAEVMQPGDAGDAHTLACLRALRERGFVLLSATPPTEEAAAELAATLGRLQGTFYGDGIWDTAPRDIEYMTDTAYSTVELPLHTDGTYLSHTPGLQLFVCAEQVDAPDHSPLDGSTKLCDGFMAARVLREEAPETYEYFCRVRLPFHHVEGGVCMDHVAAPVFDLDPSGTDVVGIRYNQLDLGPLVPPLMSPDDVAAFYTHARVLERTLVSLAMPLRLEVGHTLLLDNRRMMHGRYKFIGRRNMIGCYMNSDDWRSRLRALENRAHAEARAAHWTDDLRPPRAAPRQQHVTPSSARAVNQ